MLRNVRKECRRGSGAAGVSRCYAAGEEDQEGQRFRSLAFCSRSFALPSGHSFLSDQEKKDDKVTKRKRLEDVEQRESADPDTAVSAVGCRLFVRNLPYTATESDLVEAFGSYGDLTEVHVVLNKETQKSKGIAFVEFEDEACASAALQEMDGSIFRGRLIHILPSQEKRHKAQIAHAVETGGDEGSSFKKERAQKLKEAAGKRASWNTFYIRPDAIADAVANDYGMSKSDLMDRDASDLGVRLVLGETHVLARIKEELEQAGVDVSKLEEAAQASGRSATQTSIPRCNDVLAVKNLPYHSDAKELSEMFCGYGPVTRFVMPGIRVLAFVQFRDAADAQRAFRGLAYTKYKSVPLYLEWAPLGVLAAPPTASSAADADGKAEEREATEKCSGVSLYVKNLAFSTKDADLAGHFDTIVSEIGGQLRSARVARRKHTNGAIVSAGYGFVEVDSEEAAKHVLQKLQGSVLDGHALQLRRSAKKSEIVEAVDDDADERPATTKLVVKNLAFECTRHDVVTLFRPYGHVQSCRLPKKFDGSHRGFAFVQFVTKEEAKSARDRVQGAHLYGRRLNIDFAIDENV